MVKKANVRAARLHDEVLRMARPDDVEDVREDADEFRFSARYVGYWEVPADEEDDGDYDWKVPTAASRKVLDALVAKHGAAWENEGEKCWIRFSVAK